MEVLVVLRVTPTRRHSFKDDRNTTQITPEVYCNRKYSFVEECDVCRYEFKKKKARAGKIRLIFWIFAPSDIISRSNRAGYDVLFMDLPYLFTIEIGRHSAFVRSSFWERYLLRRYESKHFTCRGQPGSGSLSGTADNAASYARRLQSVRGSYCDNLRRGVRPTSERVLLTQLHNGQRRMAFIFVRGTAKLGFLWDAM